MSDERRAIEALRAGVPNRAAVRLLGTNSSAISDRFDRVLADARDSLRGRAMAEARSTRGLIVLGGFGAGKTHLLSFLQEQALAQDFVVSRISISKETPLFDAATLFVSCMRAAVVPRQNDDAMTAILANLKPNTERFDTLEQWASTPASGLSAIFPALLWLWPRSSTTPEMQQRIARFLAAGRPAATEVKAWLREAGAAKMFDIKTVKRAELARQCLRFAPRLMCAAGYAGWCVLLDEVELIGRYSTLQRGRAYAELARWLALEPSAGSPGIAAVAALTDDFDARVIADRRDDEKIAPALMQRGDRETSLLADLAIAELKRRDASRRLTAPGEDDLRLSLAKMRKFYHAAYGWQPPADFSVGDVLSGKSMRQYIKSWITEWDLLRLYGRPGGGIEVERIVDRYEVDRDLEHPTKPDQSDENDEP